jgi:hypothetical protein
MADNDFLPFAVGPSANVLTQAEYEALTAILQNGFQSGIAQSVQLNKVWRQSSIMAAVLAQFISDRTGQNATDDGTITTLLANLKASAAALNGDSTKVFSVAPATQSQHAVQLGQVTGLTSGRLLHRSVFTNVSGVIKVSVDGASPVTFSGPYVQLSAAATRGRTIVQAGGGSAGGGQACTSGQVAVAAGGAGGGWSIGDFPIASLVGQTISVGAGAPSDPAGGTGGTGGTSSIGSLTSATGGSGGLAALPAVPASTPFGSSIGGIGSGGQINSQGGSGLYGFTTPSPTSGFGGSSYFGPGPGGQGGVANGITGVNYGSGGSGGCNSSTGTARPGGAGAPGCIIIEEWA